MIMLILPKPFFETLMPKQSYATVSKIFVFSCHTQSETERMPYSTCTTVSVIFRPEAGSIHKCIFVCLLFRLMKFATNRNYFGFLTRQKT